MSRVSIRSTQRLQRFLNVLGHPVEPRADKVVILSARPGNIRLHSTTFKKVDGSLGAVPVAKLDFKVSGFTDDTFTVSLSAKMVEHAVKIAKKSRIVVFEVDEKQITVTGDDVSDRTEPVGRTIAPARTPWEEDLGYAEYDGIEIGRVLDAMLPAMGIIPGDANGLAVSVGAKELKVTAGCATRRGSHSVAAQSGACQPVEVLCPMYFARPLTDFIKRTKGIIRLQGEGNQLRIRGKGFFITLYRYASFTVDSIGEGTSTTIYRLSAPQVRHAQRLLHAAGTNESNPLVELSREKDALQLRYDSADSSDAATMIAQVEVENALGHSGIVRVPGLDLNRALESARKVGPRTPGLFLHIHDSKSLQLRLSDPNYLMELSQIQLAQYPLRDDLQVFGAISTSYGTAAKSNLDSFLISFFHFTEYLKNHPELFLEFLEKQGLLGRKNFLDCGAFTARARNLSINSEQFRRFIEVAYPYFINYTSLDFYYGFVSENVTEFTILLGLGLDPIYVTHLGENEKELQRVFRGEYGFIPTNVGWGGAARDGAGVRIEYVNRMLQLIPPERLAQTRIHGFGMLQESLIKRFPFSSVDASTFGIWAEHYQIPTPFGLMSLKNRASNSVFSSSLYKEVVEWVKSLSYQQPIEMNFTLERLAEDLEMRQLFGLSYYAYLGRWFRHMDHMVRLQKFIPLNELAGMDEFILPGMRYVPQSSVEDLTTIKLITKNNS